MIIEIVIAGLILMLVWWLFKSGLIWPMLGLFFLLIMALLYMSSVSAGIS